MERTLAHGAFVASLLLICMTCGCSTSKKEAIPEARTTSERKTLTTQRADVLLKASIALEDLVQRPENGIPSAVLNRTKCLVFVPHQAGTRGAVAPGIESCRKEENSWSSPKLLEFTSRPVNQMDSGDMLVLLDENARARLLRGQLKLGPGSRAFAGPTTRDVNLASNAELDQNVWMYVRIDGRLIGRTVPGALILQLPSEQNPEAAFQRIVMEARAGNPTARFQAAAISFFNTITPTGIIIHHSGIIPASRQVPADKTEVDKFHQERGFETICFGHLYHVAYHFLILPNGEVQVGRPERCQGAHAPGYNSYLGISLVGDFSTIDNPRGAKGNTIPTTRQMKSLALLCQSIRQRYDIPLQRILRHSDVSSTLCPGDRFPFTSLLHQLER